ncbi:GNAT family N-acetyltransferase [Pseudolabrys sp. FHR47]|uniref:GNAT family N-acetyltransferase n=1 Tax=Pseudolabrys sp. FHR47 TaxID=2562284 RepID=UPI0010BF1795|nr:GNAT family N-acetyltransferase [Pseudolabrys sp. FHR47]
MSVVDTRHNVQGWIAGARAALARDRGAFGDLARSEQAISEVVDILAVPEAAWADLSARAVEANAFYHPAWARAVARHVKGQVGMRALLAWDGPRKRRLIGLMLVAPAWNCLRLPLPVFVGWYAYAPLTTPLLDRDQPDDAAHALMKAAREAGAQALLLPALAMDGAVAAALRRATEPFAISPRVFNAHERARLDATQDIDEALAALGAKKLKELRRQRNRLADTGDVEYRVAAPGAEAVTALEQFLALEAAGWKGAAGTALAARQGDVAFMKEALPAMVREGAAQIVTLTSGDKVVAAGVLLRHAGRAYFFKIAYDEAFAKMSPGVLLTLDITRAMCADAAIDSVDSNAVANHPMIDHIWRDRQPIADLMLPTQAGASGFRLLAALIDARRALRDAARSLYHRLRKLKG